MDRFWSKVDKHSDAECWLWMAGKTKLGYGLFRIDNRMRTASRVAYELTYGEIADGLCVLHSCDNPNCVNPNHLRVGTRKDNAQDMVKRNRAHAKRRGIDLSEGVNTTSSMEYEGFTGTKGEGGTPFPKGTKHPSSKLQEADVLAIRASEATGASLARHYGVSEVTIHEIRKRKKWAWLDAPITATTTD